MHSTPTTTVFISCDNILRYNCASLRKGIEPHLVHHTCIVRDNVTQKIIIASHTPQSTNAHRRRVHPSCKVKYTNQNISHTNATCSHRAAMPIHDFAHGMWMRGGLGGRVTGSVRNTLYYKHTCVFRKINVMHQHHTTPHNTSTSHNLLTITQPIPSE